MKLEVLSLLLPGVKLVRSKRFADLRGYFAEVYAHPDFAMAGIPDDFVQDNQSFSIAAGTVRGLHFQISPFAQAKLVRVLQGKIFDVVVDLRRSSRTFGRHVSVDLSAESGDQLFVPAGFAHGFCTWYPTPRSSIKLIMFILQITTEASIGLIQRWRSIGRSLKARLSCRKRTKRSRCCMRSLTTSNDDWTIPRCAYW